MQIMKKHLYFFSYFPIFGFLEGTPNEPSNVQVTNIEANQLTVTWTSPDFDGGYPVTGYTVEYKEVSKLSWDEHKLDTPSATSVVVTGLEEGTEYEIRVSAVNSIGTGPFFQMLETYKTLGKHS